MKDLRDNQIILGSLGLVALVGLLCTTILVCMNKAPAAVALVSALAGTALGSLATAYVGRKVDEAKTPPAPEK